MGAAAANPIRLSASTAASEGSRRGGLDDENRDDNHDDDIDDIDDNDDDSGNNDKDLNHPSGDLRAYPRVKTEAFPYSRAEEKKILTTHLPSLTSSIVRTTASAVPPYSFAGLPPPSAARPPSSAARPRSSAVPLVGMPSPHRRVRQLSESTVDALHGVRSSLQQAGTLVDRGDDRARETGVGFCLRNITTKFEGRVSEGSYL